jgi:hypothetical protein
MSARTAPHSLVTCSSCARGRPACSRSWIETSPSLSLAAVSGIRASMACTSLGTAARASASLSSFSASSARPGRSTRGIAAVSGTGGGDCWARARPPHHTQRPTPIPTNTCRAHQHRPLVILVTNSAFRLGSLASGTGFERQKMGAPGAEVHIQPCVLHFRTVPLVHGLRQQVSEPPRTACQVIPGHSDQTL